MPPRPSQLTGFICRVCRQRISCRSSLRPLSSSARRNTKPTGEADDYYALLLSYPLPTSAAIARSKPGVPDSTRPNPGPSPTTPGFSNISSSKSPTTDVASRARLVFGSRESGPEERAKRKQERDAQASVQAGVRIPPRPSEPDNCCMSGCVNCVWDLYREELEEWAEKRQEAEMKMHGGDATDKGRQSVIGGGMAEGAVSIDDDGGGSDTNWDSSDAKLPKSQDLFESVPVGIRAFMEIEKKLAKKRQAREAAERE